MSEESAAERIEWICGQGERITGTDAERRIAKGLAARLGEGGADAAVQPIHVHPMWATVGMLHCLLGVAGSLLAAIEPAAGFALVLFAATSLYLDLTGRVYLLRRLFFRRASQNVISPPLGSEEQRPRVLICAGYDAPRTGAAYNSGPRAALERARAVLPASTSAQTVLFWSLALLLPPIGARMAGIEPDWASLAQLPQTLSLIVGAFLLGEIALSPPSPGANSNGSGVAATLEAVELLQADPPPNLEVHALLCGGWAANSQGLRNFIRAERKRLDRSRTWFVCLESVGIGTLRVPRMEVTAIGQPLDRELLAACEALAEAEGEASISLPAGSNSGAGTAAGYGYPAIALTGRTGEELIAPARGTPADTPDRIDAAAVERAGRFAADLVRLLDRGLGRRSGRAEAQPAPSTSR